MYVKPCEDYHGIYEGVGINSLFQEYFDTQSEDTLIIGRYDIYLEEHVEEVLNFCIIDGENIYVLNNLEYFNL